MTPMDVAEQVRHTGDPGLMALQLMFQFTDKETIHMLGAHDDEWTSPTGTYVAICMGVRVGDPPLFRKFNLPSTWPNNNRNAVRYLMKTLDETTAIYGVIPEESYSDCVSYAQSSTLEGHNPEGTEGKKTVDDTIYMTTKDEDKAAEQQENDKCATCRSPLAHEVGRADPDIHPDKVWDTIPYCPECSTLNNAAEQQKSDEDTTNPEGTEGPTAQDILVVLRTVRNEMGEKRDREPLVSVRNNIGLKILGTIACIDAVEEMIEERAPKKWYWYLGETRIGGHWESFGKAHRALVEQTHDEKILILVGGEGGYFHKIDVEEITIATEPS